ncbi:hypothetical protein HZB01_04405 [Candidatus Woesearchaeota archaeon]|nr:hypothetical protein [Candidatus Woesearchaeota archaeon]
MAFLSFNKKREAPANEPEPAPLGPPTDLVLSMRQQGLSNNQIVLSLQREGYSSTQIFDAMNQADIKGGIETPPGGALDQVSAPENPMQVPIAQYQPQQPAYPLSQQSQSSNETEHIEEIAEAIIDEKWDALLKNIDKIVDWKNETEQRIAKLEQKMTDLHTSFEQLHTAIVGKIGEYDEHILQVGNQLKSMETVFQKVLPSFTENVHELSRITDTMKGKK